MTAESTPTPLPTRPGLRWLVVVGSVVVLAAALYLRLRHLETSPILEDQSILLSIAMRWVNSGVLPLAANKSSAGIMNPPLIVYLLGLPLFVQPSLMAVHLFQGLLGVGAVLLVLLAGRLLGWRVALSAALLFAVNPWAVYYSRFIWNPNPIPLFSTLLFLSLIYYLLRQENNPTRSPRSTSFATTALPLALAVLTLAAITQIHLSGLVLIPTVLLLGAVFWRRWVTVRGAWLGLAIGLGLAVALYAPFLVYERAVGFTDVQATLTALVGGSSASGEVGAAETNAAAFLLLQDLATGDNLGRGRDIVGVRAWRVMTTIANLLFYASLLYVISSPLIWRWRHPGQPLPARQVVAVVLAVWLLVPVLFYVRHTVYLQDYYFLYLFPAPFLAIGLLVDEGIRVGRGRVLPTLLILIPIIGLAAGQFTILQRQQTMIASGEIPQERQARYVAAAIDTTRAVLADYPGCDLIILAEGGTLERASLALLEDFLYPTPVRFIDAQRGYIIPARCAVYFTVNDQHAAQTWLTTEGTLRPETIEAGAEQWHFYAVPGTTGTTADTQATWQNGLSLLTAEVAEVTPGAPLIIRYEWLVQQQPAPAHYHFFNHFVDSNGNILAQEDAPAIESLYWQPGDRLVTFFALPLPAELAEGTYTLYLGQYTWPELGRVAISSQEDSRYQVGSWALR